MGMDGAEARRSSPLLKTELDESALDAASLGFHRAAPARSAKRTFHIAQICVFVLIGCLLYAAWRNQPALTVSVLHACVFILFASAIVWRLFAAAALTPPPVLFAAPAAWPIYTILCPLYREANVLDELARALERLDYPRHALDVKLLVEADDSETIAAAERLESALPIEIAVLAPRAPRTKPKALNAGEASMSLSMTPKTARIRSNCAQLWPHSTPAARGSHACKRR
jgi:glycosyltransferase XagB